MQPFPQLMVEHGLDLEADERAVKRAYAKDLKKIDQQTSPEAFQQLRESYDYALAWLRHRDWQRAQQSSDDAGNETEIAEPVQLSDPAGLPAEHDGEFAPDRSVASTDVAVDEIPQSEPDDATPEKLARAVFEEMMVRIGHNPDDAATELQAALDDTRLIGIETRTMFEYGTASYLAQGWRPGNGDLFAACVKIFQWDKDAQRLLRFGDLGKFVDRALTELAIFNQQDAKHLDYQIDVIRTLRNDDRPSEDYLMKNLFLVEDMFRHYPTWLPLVTSKNNLLQWREWGKGLDWAQVRPPELQEKKSSGFDLRRTPTFLIVMIIWCLFKLATGLSSSDNTSHHSTQPFPKPTPYVASVREPATPEEMVVRGEDYLFGRDGIERDVDKTVYYWTMAANAGNMEGQMRLGTLYADGKAVPKDDAESLRWLLMAAKQGNAKAQFMVGHDYQDGAGVAKNEKSAMEWYERAAEQGNTSAQNNLGMLFHHSKPPNCMMALHWYSKAAEAGNAVAKSNLADFSLTGECGMPIDKKKALQYIAETSRLGDPHGEYLMGWAYENGLESIPVNLDWAVYWYARSAEQKNQKAQQRLNVLCKQANHKACPAGAVAVPAKSG